MKLTKTEEKLLHRLKTHGRVSAQRGYSGKYSYGNREWDAAASLVEKGLAVKKFFDTGRDYRNNGRCHHYAIVVLYPPE